MAFYFPFEQNFFSSKGKYFFFRGVGEITDLERVYLCIYAISMWAN